MTYEQDLEMTNKVNEEMVRLVARQMVEVLWDVSRDLLLKVDYDTFQEFRGRYAKAAKKEDEYVDALVRMIPDYARRLNEVKEKYA